MREDDLKMGDTVIMVDTEANKIDSEFYPPAGTLGTVAKNHKYGQAVLVKWADGSLNNTDMEAFISRSKITKIGG